jgi:putative methionine-R-sulfoxide reductase with GAF domain
MQQALKLSKEESDKRRWSNEGLSQLAMILRKASDLEESSSQAIKFLANYVGAQVIGIYLASKTADKSILQLKACFAFNREKILQQEIEAGYGLIGQVFLEGKTTCLNKVPENYLSIRSGLGDSAPRFVAIVPMIYNEEIHGILEIAAFKKLPTHVVSFLEKACENMAATFYNVNGNRETLELLERSKQSTRQLRDKEFEMRQYVEELEATREAFQMKERKLKKEIVELKDQLEQK